MALLASDDPVERVVLEVATDEADRIKVEITEAEAERYGNALMRRMG